MEPVKQPANKNSVPKRAVNDGRTGIKILLVTTALAATVAGWGAIAAADGQSTVASNQAPASTIVDRSAIASLPPLPELEPAPGPISASVAAPAPARRAQTIGPIVQAPRPFAVTRSSR